MSKQNQNNTNQKGFTLLEVLLVVGIISILAGIVILAINPSKQLGDTRNAQRRSDVNTLLNAVYQYSIDNNGAFPSGVTATATEICSTTGATCTTNSLADLGALTTNGKYLVAIPVDPSGPAAPNTKYRIVKSATTNRITVDAMVTDNSASITATR